MLSINGFSVFIQRHKSAVGVSKVSEFLPQLPSRPRSESPTPADGRRAGRMVNVHVGRNPCSFATLTQPKHPSAFQITGFLLLICVFWPRHVEAGVAVTAVPAGRKHLRRRRQSDQAKGEQENNFCVVFDCDEQGWDTPRRTEAFVESR